jgi:hypothetical protein
MRDALRLTEAAAIYNSVKSCWKRVDDIPRTTKPGIAVIYWRSLAVSTSSSGIAKTGNSPQVEAGKLVLTAGDCQKSENTGGG